MGKTITDEMAYSLSGENHWYGMPVNPGAPGRTPGGSSSGSASAVAAAECDFALGTDTGGSVRIPSSFCRLFGLRTSHGALSLEGVMPLAPSFDTIGWFARSSALLRRVGEVLLGHLPPPQPDVRMLVEPLELEERWMDTFIILQRHEVWLCHGEWVGSARPQFGPGVAERFEAASRVTAEEVERAQGIRAEVVAKFVPLLEGAVAILPTAPSEAPFPGAGDDFRRRCLHLLCLAGLAGLPQLSLPLGPIGVSLLGGRGTDRTLLALAERLC